VRLSRFCIPPPNCESQSDYFAIENLTRTFALRFNSVCADHNIAPSSRRSQLRSAPAVFVLILVNCACFSLFEISGWGLERSKVFCIGLGRSSRTRCCTTRILASFHWAFSTWRLFASRVQPFRPLRSRSAARRSIGTIDFSRCYLISGLASGAGVVALKKVGGSRR